MLIPDTFFFHSRYLSEIDFTPLGERKLRTPWKKACPKSFFEDFRRYDCYPDREGEISRQDCLARGCCYRESTNARVSSQISSRLGKLWSMETCSSVVLSHHTQMKLSLKQVSSCFLPMNKGYRHFSGPNPVCTRGYEYILDKDESPMRYGDEAAYVTVRIEHQTTDRLRIKVNTMYSDRLET